MKKSCPTKEFKVATTQDSENGVTVSKESTKEQLTEEQLKINQKLNESGIEDEGLSWLEKRNIFKTINVSLDTAGSERVKRYSPKLTKSTDSRAAKWIENSFETPKQENHSNNDNEKVVRTKSNKKVSEGSSSKKSNSSNPCKRQYQETEESASTPNHKVETNSCDKKDEGINYDTPKSSKKVHYIKVHIEERSEEACNSSAEGGSHSVSLGRKRTSQLEVKSTETPKKIKMEETNNGVSSEEETPLKVELEMERRKRSAPFKLRDIKTIVSECETRNKKWKETFLKYNCPARWGMPIVRNCSEKWDGKQIPQKLLSRYQKYLSSNNLTHPIFLPVKSQSSFDLNKFNSEISLQSGTSLNSEFIDEPENIKNLSQESIIHSDSNRTDVENNLNASTSVKDVSERMVLRNRSQQKIIISDGEEFSSDDSDEWVVMQKSSKKQRINSKKKKALEQSNKQLVLKLEGCNINRGNGNESGRKNGSKNESGFIGGVVSSNSMNQAGGNSKARPDPDTMVCPICSLRFKKQLIESHATECASKTYKD